MSDIAGFAEETVKELDHTLKDVRIPRARLGPCPVCGHEIVENRKGYSCWSREDPGCGFVIWKSKAGKTLPIAVARELIKTGYTERPVTGFRGRSGRTFRARLALSQTEDGKWRVEFDEDWAREGAKPPEAEADSGELAEARADGAASAGLGQRSAA
jgi:DNA topoisomerase-3